MWAQLQSVLLFERDLETKRWCELRVVWAGKELSTWRTTKQKCSVTTLYSGVGRQFLERVVVPTVMNGAIFREWGVWAQQDRNFHKISRLDRVRKEKKVMRKPRVWGKVTERVAQKVTKLLKNVQRMGRERFIQYQYELHVRSRFSRDRRVFRKPSAHNSFYSRKEINVLEKKNWKVAFYTPGYQTYYR